MTFGRIQAQKLLYAEKAFFVPLVSSTAMRTFSMLVSFYECADSKRSPFIESIKKQMPVFQQGMPAHAVNSTALWSHGYYFPYPPAAGAAGAAP
jgi:hypothetical protein